jgi:hypothetical protein
MSLRLTWSCTAHAGCLRLSGMPRGTVAALASAPAARVSEVVRVVPSELADAAATMQTIAVTAVVDGEDCVCLIPRFPFLPGTALTVLLASAGSGAAGFARASTVCPDEGVVASTSVVEIAPTCAGVPRNLLRLSVEFSARMMEGEVAERVGVRCADTGAPIPGAFLPTDHELWDVDHRRVTILFDPARLKRGLAPNLELGTALQVGSTIEVVVDAAFRDARGAPLLSEATRRYVVGGDVRTRIDLAGWDVTSPRAGTDDPLVVRFDRSLDLALLRRCLQVTEPDGTALDGDVSIRGGERVWSFRPAEPWQHGRHAIHVDPVLEDLAGNSLMRVFDRDLTIPDDAPAGNNPLAVDFLVR